MYLQDDLDEPYEVHEDNGYLKRDVREYCGGDLKSRVNAHSPVNTIRLDDERFEVKELVGEDEKVERFLNIIGDIIIEEESTGGGSKYNNRVDFRQLELVKIANNLDKIEVEAK